MGESAAVVGFTGTREGLTIPQYKSLFAWFAAHPSTTTLHHGDCIGADAEAHRVAIYCGWPVEIHPAVGPVRLRSFRTGYSHLHPAKPNPERNTDIVNAATELLACPKGAEVVRSGTWSTVRKARARGIPITIIWPNGLVARDQSHPPTQDEHPQPTPKEGSDD